MMTRRHRIALSAVAAAAGAALFAYAVHRVGTREIVDGITRVGWGLVPILALAGLRFAARAEAWRMCTPPGKRLSMRRALTAFLAGDAVGNVTPLGLIASEPTKVFLTRHHLATRESVSSLAVDNLIYVASVLMMIVGGTIVMLVTVPLPLEWEEWGIVAIVGLVGASILGVVAIRVGGLGLGRRLGWPQRISKLRQAILEYSTGHPARLWRAFALDLSFHGLAIAETFLTLRWLLGDRSPTFTQAIVFEALNRIVTILFKFVPFRVGVDEAISGAFAPLVSVDPVTGVSLAVIRKVRNLFWTAVGLAFIGAHHAESSPQPDQPGNARAHRT